MLEQRLRVGIPGIVGRVDWRQADAGASAADRAGNGAHHFQQQACAVFDAAAIVVGAVVGAALQKLVEQVTVGTVDFGAVEPAGLDRVTRGRLVAVHYGRQFARQQGARRARVHKRRHAGPHQHGFCFGADGRWPHRRAAVWLQLGVGDTPHVPELHHYFSACRMYVSGDVFPAVELLGAIQPWSIGLTVRPPPRCPCTR